MESTSEIEVEFIEDEHASADNSSAEPRPDFVLPKFIPSAPVGYNIANVDGSVDTLAPNFNEAPAIDPRIKEAAQLALIERLLKEETRKAEAERARKGRVKKRKRTAKMAKASRRRNR